MPVSITGHPVSGTLRIYLPNAKGAMAVRQSSDEKFNRSIAISDASAIALSASRLFGLGFQRDALAQQLRAFQRQLGA